MFNTTMQTPYVTLEKTSHLKHDSALKVDPSFKPLARQFEVFTGNEGQSEKVGSIFCAVHKANALGAQILTQGSSTPVTVLNIYQALSLNPAVREGAQRFIQQKKLDIHVDDLMIVANEDNAGYYSFQYFHKAGNREYSGNIEHYLVDNSTTSNNYINTHTQQTIKPSFANDERLQKLGINYSNLSLLAQQVLAATQHEYEACLANHHGNHGSGSGTNAVFGTVHAQDLPPASSQHRPNSNIPTVENDFFAEFSAPTTRKEDDDDEFGSNLNNNTINNRHHPKASTKSRHDDDNHSDSGSDDGWNDSFNFFGSVRHANDGAEGSRNRKNHDRDREKANNRNRNDSSTVDRQSARNKSKNATHTSSSLFADDDVVVSPQHQLSNSKKKKPGLGVRIHPSTAHFNDETDATSKDKDKKHVTTTTHAIGTSSSTTGASGLNNDVSTNGNNGNNDKSVPDKNENDSKKNADLTNTHGAVIVHTMTHPSLQAQQGANNNFLPWGSHVPTGHPFRHSYPNPYPVYVLPGQFYPGATGRFNAWPQPNQFGQPQANVPYVPPVIQLPQNGNGGNGNNLISHTNLPSVAHSTTTPAQQIVISQNNDQNAGQNDGLNRPYQYVFFNQMQQPSVPVVVEQQRPAQSFVTPQYQPAQFQGQYSTTYSHPVYGTAQQVPQQPGQPGMMPFNWPSYNPSNGSHQVWDHNSVQTGVPTSYQYVGNSIHRPGGFSHTLRDGRYDGSGATGAHWRQPPQHLVNQHGVVQPGVVLNQQTHYHQAPQRRQQLINGQLYWVQ